MKILSFNAREWSRDMNPFSPHFWMKRMSKMRKMLLQEKPDVICFQEMRWPATWYIPKEYKRITKANTSHPIYAVEQVKSHDLGCNSFASYCCICSSDSSFSPLYIYSVHLPCDDVQRDVKLMVLQGATQSEKRSRIICGDFNDIPRKVMPYFPHLKLLSPDICTYESFETGTEACIDHFIGNIEGRYEYIDEDSWEGRMSDHYPIMIEV